MKPTTICLRLTDAQRKHVFEHLTRIRNLNPSLNAFTSFWKDDDLVLKELDRLPDGPLSGLTVAVKDIFCTRDFPTTCASQMLKDYQSPFDATVVKSLRDAGAFVIGKTNMDEFGMGSSNLNSIFGPTFAPTNEEYADVSDRPMAGGSSGGSAAAVAADMCDFALASDTGGSTRLPAAYCGITGLKASYGIISRYGMVAYASSLDCVGIMSKSPKQIESVFDVLAFKDEKDPTSKSLETRKHARENHNQDLDLSNIKIGIPKEYFPKELSPIVHEEITNSLKSIKSKSQIKLESVNLEYAAQGLSTYYVLASSEASSNLARYDGAHYGFSTEHIGEPRYLSTRTEGFGNEAKQRILLGTYALTAEAYDNYVLQAQKIRSKVSGELENVLKNKVDYLICPSTISTDRKFGQEVSNLNNRANQDITTESYGQDLLTVGASLAGLPSVSIPVGSAKVGMQIIGQWGSEKNLLDLANKLQQILQG